MSLAIQGLRIKSKKFRNIIRSLSKLAFVREIQEGSERKTGVNTTVNEDLSTEPTQKFSTQVEFRKRSIDL